MLIAWRQFDRNRYSNVCLVHCTDCRHKTKPTNEDVQIRKIMVCANIEPDNTLSYIFLSSEVHFPYSKVIKILHKIYQQTS